MKKVKVLEITSSLNIGGAETLLVNLLENIDKEKYSIDFLCYGSDSFAYESKVKKLGSNVFRINNPTDVGMFKHMYEVYSFLKKTKYDVVHCHNLFNCGPVLFSAFFAGVKVRIAHSHTTVYLNDGPISFKKKVYYFLAKKMISCFANKRFACGKEAGLFLFGNKKFKIIKNGINTQKFIFSEENRKKIRKKYNIDNSTFVLGHVGRFVPIKNHQFLIQLFSEFVIRFPNSKLLLVGDGELLTIIQNMVNNYRLQDDVIFVGSKTNVNDYYSAFDCFVFPSISEGLPLTLVEAQTNGLPIVASNGIYKESNITKTIQFEELDIEKWVKAIISAQKKTRCDNLSKIVDSGYDIINSTKVIEEEYSNLGV